MSSLIIRDLGQQDYELIWRQMQEFANSPQTDRADEFWLVEHPPVFTQGQAGKAEHLLMPGNIPVIQTDRGGQVTYHGPGQQILYVLINVKRLNLGIRQLVTAMEQSVIQLLAEYGLSAEARADAPGVYIEQAKICSLGLRIRKGYSYHGLALNLDLDLTPFERINPCGYSGLRVTRLQDWAAFDRAELKARLVEHLQRLLGYNRATLVSGPSNESAA